MSDLGPCCICETYVGVTNILMIDKRGPVAGTGWGCVVCGLPNDGAAAVLCDGCMKLVEAGAVPLLVCSGYPGEGKRVPYAELSDEVFTHDEARHREELGS